MRVLILANGEPPQAALAARLAAEHDLLMATDGAAHKALMLGLTPQIVCGDFDSVELEAAQAAFPDAEFVPTPDQNLADLEKAIHLALLRGATAITVTGAAGGRIDHTLANHALLLRYGREVPLTIVEDGVEVCAVFDRCLLKTRLGDTVSLIAFGADVRVSIAGTRWVLQDAPLAPGAGGVSNIATGDRVTVILHTGDPILVCKLS